MISRWELSMASDSIQIPGYEILRPLGSGGMSTVYLALQTSLDRKVAVKVMRRPGDPDSADARQTERRFLLEGRMMAKLPHRNIAAVYDIVSNDNIAYIAMEYLGGGALTDRMRAGIELADAVSVIVQIAGALEFAHGHRVVHRDLKPANIMFRDGGTPVLTDFGIARFQDGSGMRLTQTGMLVGTPTYMSPEQINGIAVDGRADQYSLGILFYELLTGAPPFRGDTPISVLMAHLTQQPAPLPVEFRSFQDVFDRMLAKDREARYSNLLEFAEDLKSRLFGSNTLLMRLQLDPEQSSSEQLRALGFQTSMPGTLRDSASGMASGPRAIAKPAPPVAQGTPARSAASTSAPSTGRPRPKWLWPVIAAVLLVLIIGSVWFAFGPVARRQLNADELELVRIWTDRAQERIAGDQLVPAAGESESDSDSALAYVRKVLQKDPGNARAQKLLGDIAERLRAQAENALTAGKPDIADELVGEGLQLRPDNTALKKLRGRIAEARKQAVERAGKEKPAAATAEPTTSAVRETAGQPVNGGAVPAAAEQAADVSRGELVLNASPWATIESVLDANRRPVALPADASTPLVLSVPAGSYVITFRHPRAAKSVQVIAKVEAKKRVSADATFPTITSQEYFSRAGW
jgi:serine/threonine protein kinase